LLDVYANKNKFGKQVGGDIIANKKTFLLIKAFEKARSKQKSELVKWTTAKKFNRAEKVKAVTSIYNSLHIPMLAEQKIKYFFEKGFACLDNLTNPSSAKQLKDFVQKLIDRES
jgi:geranylgeranyl diphosphate synthase type II